MQSPPYPSFGSALASAASTPDSSPRRRVVRPAPPKQMMYTPSPAARRPRPPASLAKSRLSASTSSSSSSRPSLALSMGRRAVSPGGDGQKPSGQRPEAGRSTPAKDTASPGSVGDVSLGLDVRSPEGPASTHPSSSGTLGVPNDPTSHKIHTADTAEPSPPPPYGHELPNPSPVPHKPQQNASDARRPHEISDGAMRGEERQDAEENMRARRATEAARAIGLDMDFGASNSGGEEDSELEEDEEELRRRLRSVRKRLRQRDKELLMAAQVADQALRQHEQVLSQLSPTAKSHLPQLLSLLSVAPANRSRPSSRPSSRSGSRLSNRISPPSSGFRHSTSRSAASISSMLSPPSATEELSPDRLRNFKLVNGQTEYHRKASRPRAFQSSNSSTSQRYQVVQAEEADERILALEAALMEAQEGEENQRKAMARMRREHDKMKRDLERAEGMLSESQTISGLTRTAGSRGVRQKKMEQETSSAFEPHRMSYDPYRAQREEADERDGRLDGPVREVRDERELDSSMSSNARPRHQQSSSDRRGDSGSHSSALRHLGENKRIRKAVSRSSFLSPPKQASAPYEVRRPLTPTLHVHSPESLETESPTPSAPQSTLRARTHPRPHSPASSHSRSPDARPSSIRPSSSPARSLGSVSSSRLQSPGFTSISARMASMRDFVADSLFLAPTPVGPRTLGSELGSDFGDDWESRAWAGSSFVVSTTPGRPVQDHQAQLEGLTRGEADEGDDADEGEWEDEPQAPLAEDDGDQTMLFNSPATLPPLASSALASLALALAPAKAHTWDYDSSPSASVARRRPKDSLRVRRVDFRTSTRRLPREEVTPAFGSDGQAGRPDRTREVSPSPAPSGRRTDGMALAWQDGPLDGAESSEDEAHRSESIRSVSGPTGGVSGVRASLGRGKAPQIAQGGNGLILQRPRVDRAGSSQSSIALAHRRAGTVPRGGEQKSRVEPRQIGQNVTAGHVREHNTITGRLVYDLLVWSVIILEWIECLAILGIRVLQDIRRGRNGVLARNFKALVDRRRRYYL